MNYMSTLLFLLVIPARFRRESGDFNLADGKKQGRSIPAGSTRK
jgi:hypothetical protein